MTALSTDNTNLDKNTQKVPPLKIRKLQSSEGKTSVVVTQIKTSKPSIVIPVLKRKNVLLKSHDIQLDIPVCFKNILRGTFWCCGLPINNPIILDDLGRKLLIYLRVQILEKIQTIPDLEQLIKFLVTKSDYDMIKRLVQAYYKFMNRGKHMKSMEQDASFSEKDKKAGDPLFKTFLTVLSPKNATDQNTDKFKSLETLIKKFKYASSTKEINTLPDNIFEFINSRDDLDFKYLKLQDKISKDIFENKPKMYENWQKSKKTNCFRMTDPEKSSTEISIECLAFFFNIKCQRLTKSQEIYFRFFKILLHDVVIQIGMGIGDKLGDDDLVQILKKIEESPDVLFKNCLFG